MPAAGTILKEVDFVAKNKSKKNKIIASDFEIRVYVKHGYFSYRVGSVGSAMEHAQVIMESRTYRRSNERGEVEFHHVDKVKVVGDGLDTAYPDVFKRT